MVEFYFLTFPRFPKNTNPTLARIELTTSALPSRCAGYLLDHSGDCKDKTSSWHLIGFTDGSN
ncbi:unnamed protein product, partial [Ascophyllum nodosum]